MSDRSSSVVAYGSIKSPVSYNELAVNTNINVAPSGWLQGKFADQTPFAPKPLKTKTLNRFLICMPGIEQY